MKTHLPVSAFPLEGSRRAARAFTLLEILITVSIIAALIAVAVPATERVIHKARASACLGNLRNLGSALQIYLNENGNIMPTLVTARESKESDEAAIDNTLDQYTEDKKVFCCPGDAKRICDVTGTSYAWTSMLNGQNATTMNLLGVVRDGSRIPVITDKEGWHKYRDVQVNILYADGHVGKDVKFVAGE
jgi:prepilin-type N-terminal cleavage/methylation domain-containing protein/prepilin-type processing-associated H-X9-DG protein